MSLNRLRHRLLSLGASKFRQDILWNLVSLAVLGISGILMNLIIARTYGAAVLGIFNQTFAAYILFSQFAAGGVHLSTAKHVAEHSDDRKKTDAIITSAALLTLILASFATLAFWLMRGRVGVLLDSPGVEEGMKWAAPGVFLFAVNKTLLGAINGLRWMRTYAAAMALRGVLWLVTLFAVIGMGWPGERVALILSVSEAGALVLVLARICGRFCAPAAAGTWDWARRHFIFGLRSFGSGVLLELNTRVDVLMLGVWWSDAVVGVYSFASMLVEGFAQIPLIVRANVNPMMAQHLSTRNDDALAVLIRKVRRATYFGMFALGVVAAFAYPLAVGLATDNEVFRASWPVFVILLTGMTLSSGYIPFGQVLLQAGRPGTHTLMIVTAVGFNVVGNLLLIPAWGATGAALATASAFVFSTLLLIVLAKRLTNVSMYR